MERERRRRREPKQPKPKKSIPKMIFSWTFEIIVVILFAYVLVYFFGQTRTNIGQSMDPTISGGATVLLDDLSYRLGTPKRNDVIAFKPNGSENKHTYIKRVLGLPGETVQIIDGILYINGRVYLEKHDFMPMNDPGIAKEAIVLGSDEYFVLGDNRNNSEDSRFADVGIVKKSYIEGKVWFVVSPREQFGLVK